MKAPHSHHTRRNLDRLARRPLCRSLAFCLATAAIATPAAHAQSAPPSISLPTPNIPPIQDDNSGAAAGDQSGALGGNANPTSDELDNGYYTSSIVAQSIGGAGGTGTNGGDPTGNGGNGGNGANVVFTVQPGSGVNSDTTGLAAVDLDSSGGVGGTAGAMDSESGNPGQPGGGGNAGNVTFSQSGTVISTNGWSGSTPGTTAVLMRANGGDAGEPLGYDGAAGGGKVTGANGNVGGAGGQVTYNLYQGDVSSKGSGIVAQSKGGTGGDGTGSYSYIGIGQGGNGGPGGAAGAVQMTIGQASSASNIVAAGAPTAAAGVVVPVDDSGDTAQAALMAAGIQAQSMGGDGGYGGQGDGTAGKAGAGGAGGDASTVGVAIVNANVYTTGFAAAGVLAQSVGGAGGNGNGAGGIFYKKGGNGAKGGAAAAVTVDLGDASNTVWPSNLIATSGDDSMGVVAQSVGGGGGAGGAVSGGSIDGGVAIGGNGQTGGTAGVVTLANGALSTGSDPAQYGYIIATQGERSSGLVAQSIGGGGGSGGTASMVDTGAFSYTVGGNGGSGGAAGTAGTTQVTLDNLGIVSTTGNHAKGMVAQAVGGGGGDGGGAQSLTAGAQINVSVTVGGNGGSGGTAGDVIGANLGEILTAGADAWGLLAQSVAGGGGNGGSSVSDAFEFAANTVIPSVVVNASIGGTGGDGAGSGNVTATNDAVIMTAGPGAHGMLAQSISGGGGNGGDSSALTAGNSTGKGANLDVTVALGGSGGQGGAAGNVTVNNTANSLIWTTGEGSDGIFAQSVAGGGGSGGTSKLTNEYLGGGQKGTLAITLGGSGGIGSTGGTVDVTNDGNVMTLGDGSNGILAQSVGGGGGLGSGGSIKGSAAKVSETLTVTGRNGGGGDGGAVNVTNNATVLTYGGDAAAIYAQSIGGGGGKVGTGTTAGLFSTDLPLSSYLAASKQFAGKTGTYGGVTAFAPNGWQASSVWQMEAWATEYLDYAAANSNAIADGTNGVANVNLYLGGTGTSTSTGAGGEGGNVSVTNTMTAQTSGPASAGIFAQSIGASGGQIGEYVVDQYKTATSNHAALSVNVNGQAFSYGDGGTVDVTNNGNIVTAGDASFGVLAQSIGGGGGESVITASQYEAATGAALQIALSDSVNNTGNGGVVTVNQTSGALNASIATAGNDAVGVVAQSIGGGGGNVVAMQTTATAAGTLMGVTDPTRDETGSLNSVTVGTFTLPFAHEMGCDVVSDSPVYNSCGTGGAVNVSTGAGTSITTKGTNAHGVLAQSLGGGGGWIVGLSESATNPFNSPAMAGNAGKIDLSLGGSISTGGDGAYGVLAQSVGGGGVLGGDLAAATTASAFPVDDPKKPNNRVGSGGDIVIDNTGSIVTTGKNAHAIFAQSVGGGGGLYTTGTLGANGVTWNSWMGTSGGQGDAGPVTITNSGLVQASGTGSSAVYVNTQGQSDTSQVSVSNTGTITGNSSAPAILLTGGNKNGDGSVVNSGTIGNVGGTAISAPDSFAAVTNNTGGTINGSLDLGISGMLQNHGTWGTGGGSSGVVENAADGTLNIGGGNADPLGASSLAGMLQSSGVIGATTDFFNAKASLLNVLGVAALNNGTSIALNPLSITRTPVTILTGEVVTSPAYIGVTDPGNSFLIDYGVTRPTPQSLDVQVIGSQFLAQAKTYAPQNTNAQQVAAQWNTDISVNPINQGEAQTLARFATIGNGVAYVQALNQLTNESAQAATVAHVVAGNAFVERMNSCPRFEDGAQDTREHDCVWGRVIGNDGDRDASGDSVGYHQSGNVFQLGGQKEVATDWFVGASASADESDLGTIHANDDVHGHGFTAGVVIKHQMNDWLVSAALEGGSMSYDATRRMQLPGMDGTAQGDYDVSHWGIHSRISRQIAFNSWYLRPYVDLHATHIHADGYTEQGAGPLDLTVKQSTTNVFGASPMLEAGSNFVFGNGASLQVYGAVGGTFYNQGTLGADMRFADAAPGNGSFHIASDLPSDRFKATAGLDLKTSDHWDMRLEYGGEFASHFKSNTDALKVTYKF